ncbi:flagellar hook length control protein FliK [Lelliottia nimipressuralis]|uniref:flagellar hook length control protein FliK n=1 Tax=Lelliottia nimipressuralis TaxID=69220 RepID=UPI001E5A043C|nr:flagellar hook length control protein FliK [Lelliottia nimipressuralis]MCD4560354.1 flagellar hook length control protein FliK [Lelliottia nimipressuralis]
MITLQQLLMTDTDLSGGTQTGKGAEGAQDFLSLLAGALSDTAGQGKDAPITLASLKAATSKLSKEAILKDGDSALQTKLATLLARQDQLVADDTAQEAPLQTLVSGLIPATHGDALKALTANTNAQKDDLKTDLNDEELAGLSALMAMLPHQQTATAAVAQAVETHTVATQPTAAQPASGRASLMDVADFSLRGKTQANSADADSNPLPASAQPLTPAAAASAAKQDVVSAGSATAPTSTLAPILASNITAPPAAAAAPAPVISQPLGTHEWQQAVSQHVTLFTKQGQQSAELRLHPEDLGQVQISLKLEDNQAQLQMVSAHSNVRAALEAALPMLRTQLAENGIQLSQSNISSESFAGQQQSSSQQQQQASRSGQQGGFNDDNDELLVTPAALQSAARGNGAVDIFA